MCLDCSAYFFPRTVAGDDVHFPATGATVRAVPAKQSAGMVLIGGGPRKAISLPGDTFWKVCCPGKAPVLRARAKFNDFPDVRQGASGRKPLRVGDDVSGLDGDQLAVLAPGITG